MGEFLNFVNRYSNEYNFDLQYNDYVNIKAYVINAINETLSFRGVKFEQMDALVDFTMCFLLSMHTPKEILANGYEEEIERAVERVYNKQEEQKPKEKQVPFPEKNEAVTYIYRDLKDLAYIFIPGFNLGELSKNIRDSLNFDGYKDEEIVEGKCDQIIIEYLAKGYFDVRYSEDFKDMRLIVSNLVVSYFNFKKKDTRYYTNRDNFEYMYYDNRTNMNNVIFCVTLAFLDNGVNPRKINSSSPEMEVIYNYIQRDMIRINSTRHKPESVIETWKKLSREEKQEKLDKAKKTAIVIAIIFGLIGVENMIYNSIHNKGRKQTRNKYSLETNAYDIDMVSNKVQTLRYNSSDNTIDIPQEIENKIALENSPIDETIEQNIGEEEEENGFSRV